MNKVTLTAVIHREADWYVAECPEVGTVSQGTTIEDAIQNLSEATELYLEEFPQFPPNLWPFGRCDSPSVAYPTCHARSDRPGSTENDLYNTARPSATSSDSRPQSAGK